MNGESSRALVLSYYQALGRGDAAALQKLLADDVVWCPPRSAPIENEYRGRDAVLAGMAETGARFFDLATAKMETRKIVADGDTVVVLQHFACTAANGRAYDNEYVWVFTCADGKIARMDEHTDTVRFQEIVLSR